METSWELILDIQMGKDGGLDKGSDGGIKKQTVLRSVSEVVLIGLVIGLDVREEGKSRLEKTRRFGLSN